jgi:hypothetical protein
LEVLVIVPVVEEVAYRISGLFDSRIGTHDFVPAPSRRGDGRARLPERHGPIMATFLIFVGRYAIANGVEVEVLDVADLDIIGSAIVAIGFLLFTFGFFFGVGKITSLKHRLAKKVALAILYCVLSAGLLGLALFVPAG